MNIQKDINANVFFFKKRHLQQKLKNTPKSDQPKQPERLKTAKTTKDVKN